APPGPPPSASAPSKAGAHARSRSESRRRHSDRRKRAVLPAVRWHGQLQDAEVVRRDARVRPGTFDPLRLFSVVGLVVAVPGGRDDRVSNRKEKAQMTWPIRVVVFLSGLGLTLVGGALAAAAGSAGAVSPAPDTPARNLPMRVCPAAAR